MKAFSLTVAALFFTVIFAVSAFAQTNDAKIGLLDVGAFDADKGGIAKFVAALNKVDAELKTDKDAITLLGTKFQALQKEIQGYQDIISKGGKIPIADAEVQKKVDELGKMERDIKFKGEEYKARYERSYQINVGPVWADILKALSEFAEQKGYAVIFDGGKLEQAGVLLGFSKKYNVTQEFITFYNARPATTAVTTPIK
jgi:Skp family chaperone for outer membrane proteins